MSGEIFPHPDANFSDATIGSWGYDSVAIDYKIEGLGVTTNFSANEITVATGTAAIGYQLRRVTASLDEEQTEGFASSDSDNYVFLEFDASVLDSVTVAVYDSEGAAPESSLLLAVVDPVAEETDEQNGVMDIGEHVTQHEQEGNDQLNVDGLSGDLADEQDPKTHDNSSHTVFFAELTEESGVLTSSQVPDLAISETYTVADETERLALDVEEGDVAIQEDNSTTHLFTGGDPSIESDWSEIIFDSVAHIAGETIEPSAITNQNYIETPEVVADAGSSQTLDLDVSNQYKITLSEDCTLSFANAVNGASLTLYVAQDGTGSHSVTWPTVLVPNGVEPTVTQGANAIDRFVFDRIDGDWYLTEAGAVFEEDT